MADLEASIQASSLRIHQLSSAFASASAEAASLDQQLAGQLTALGHLRAAAAASRASLLTAAVNSYTSAAPGSGATLPDTGVGAVVGAEYLALASNSVSDTLDAYRLRERRVATAVALIRRERSAARADAAQAASARDQALATAAAEQASLDALQTRLARQAAAAHRAPTTQGGPVNGGLVAMVRSQTSGPPASATPATTAATAPATTAPPRTAPPTTAHSSPPPAAPPTTSPPTTAPPTTAPPTTAPPTTAPPTTAPPTTTPPSAGGGAGGVWYELRMCESGDNYRENTGNGFYGAYQFSEQTWTSLGYPGRPDLGPPAMQDAAARKLQAESGWGQWPACSAALGLT